MIARARAKLILLTKSAMTVAAINNCSNDNVIINNENSSNNSNNSKTLTTITRRATKGLNTKNIITHNSCYSNSYNENNNNKKTQNKRLPLQASKNIMILPSSFQVQELPIDDQSSSTVHQSSPIISEEKRKYSKKIFCGTKTESLFLLLMSR